jgi:hypothetical protein
MTLHVSGNEISGYYRSAIGEAEGEGDFPLRGFVSGDLISYTVNFGQFATLVSWVGQFAPDDHSKAALRTVFVAAVNVEDENEANHAWGSVRTGSDTYTKSK